MILNTESLLSGIISRNWTSFIFKFLSPLSYIFKINSHTHSKGLVYRIKEQLLNVFVNVVSILIVHLTLCSSPLGTFWNISLRIRPEAKLNAENRLFFMPLQLHEERTLLLQKTIHFLRQKWKWYQNKRLEWNRSAMKVKKALPPAK